MRVHSLRNPQRTRINSYIRVSVGHEHFVNHDITQTLIGYLQCGLGCTSLFQINTWQLRYPTTPIMVVTTFRGRI